MSMQSLIWSCFLFILCFSVCMLWPSQVSMPACLCAYMCGSSCMLVSSHVEVVIAYMRCAPGVKLICLTLVLSVLKHGLFYAQSCSRVYVHSNCFNELMSVCLAFDAAGAASGATSCEQAVIMCLFLCYSQFVCTTCLNVLASPCNSS